MARPTIRAFDLQIHKIAKHYLAVAEADIRQAHGQEASRPAPLDHPEHLYEAARHSMDEDQKAYDAEIEAQWREASGKKI